MAGEMAALRKMHGVPAKRGMAVLVPVWRDYGAIIVRGVIAWAPGPPGDRILYVRLAGDAKGETRAVQAKSLVYLDGQDRILWAPSGQRLGRWGG